MTFPFEAVYKKIAHQIMSTGIPKDDTMHPLGWIVGVMPDQDLKLVPMPDISSYFVSNAGKAELGARVRNAVQAISAVYPECCSVIATEAYMRIANNVDKESAADIAKRHGGSVKDHPDAFEVVIIMMQTTTHSCVGSLKILPDRSLEFMPFNGVADDAIGSFAHNPPERT